MVFSLTAAGLGCMGALEAERYLAELDAGEAPHPVSDLAEVLE